MCGFRISCVSWCVAHAGRTATSHRRLVLPRYRALIASPSSIPAEAFISRRLQSSVAFSITLVIGVVRCRVRDLVPRMPRHLRVSAACFVDGSSLAWPGAVSFFVAYAQPCAARSMLRHARPRFGAPRRDATVIRLIAHCRHEMPLYCCALAGIRIGYPS